MRDFPYAPLLTLWMVAVGGVTVGAQGPAWWVERGVLSGDAPADFAPLTQGQMKWLATNASDELDVRLNLVGGAGSNVHAMVWGFGGEHNAQVVLVGQLKHVAQPFYNRLMAVGYADAYPWSGEPAEEADFAVANIGQAKSMFAFDMAEDLDDDGLSDWAETDTGIFVSPTDTGTDPLLADTDGDGTPDGEEVANRTDPNNTDTEPPSLMLMIVPSGILRVLP